MPERRCQALLPGETKLCGNSLEGLSPLAKTCSPACKARLARANKAAQKRRARERKAQKRNGLEVIAEAAAGGTDTLDIARDVLREELREHIHREALTEDVLADLAKMINFAPAAIQVLSLQLASEDETIAQRAANLILKYTMGNASVAPEGVGRQPAQLQVILGMPDRVNGATEELPSDVIDTRTCNRCHETKPADEFVGKSERCQRCFDLMQLEVVSKFTPKDGSKP
jgi:hypothetical protein